jgi:hypothetical protein
MAEELHLKRAIWPASIAFLWGLASPLLVLTVLAVIFAFHVVNPYCCSRFDEREWLAAEKGTDWEVTENK